MTFTEEARRRQLVDVTIGMLAEHGYGRCSLARIAEAAGVTKGAVLYHFRSKDAVVRAAYEHVLGELVTAVGTAVDAAPTPGAAVDAYVTTMLSHLGARRDHARVLADSLDAAVVRDRDDRPARWRPVAALIEAAQAAGQYRAGDPRVLAVALGGAIDGLVAEKLADPSFDLDEAAATLNGRAR
ncbi:TetR/AcrR family transcriptional regulator [Actinomycetospora sp. CA-084318]|uniref:TetR/AcrR family transcriptional regulator n=1 Tax=Actinomycetospora sp. CA-084318 TaxID=3239892 RepID=UPI003D95378C